MSNVEWPSPVLDPWGLPFWQAVRENRLVLQRCRSCGTVRYPPGPSCHACLGADASWEEASGLGTVESWVVFHQSYFDGLESALPYNVALIRLEEGVPFISNIVRVSREQMRIGLKVRVVFDAVPGAGTLPRFAPLEPGAAT